MEFRRGSLEGLVVDVDQNRSGHRASESRVIGVIPAAGKANRVGPLPCSKELYPVGFRTISEGEHRCPKVACHYLLERMQLAGISEVYIVLREGKWDIPAYLRDGADLNMHLAYLMMGLPYGAPCSIDQAFPFVKDVVVAFGFPDIVNTPKDDFAQLLNWLKTSQADVVLGLFPAERTDKVDMVEMANDKRVRRIVIKPRQTHLRYTWGLAVWTPVFSSFMHEYLTYLQNLPPPSSEIYVGEAIQAAIDNGLGVEGLQVSDEPFLDIGTPEDLYRAVNSFTPSTA